MNKRLQELQKLCAESLKDRLLNQFTYPDRICSDCCDTCPDWKSTKDTECESCEVVYKYDPVKGVFVCRNGHEVEPLNFYNDIEPFIEAVFWNLDEFVENETLLKAEDINLPILMGNLRFQSSKDLLEERLKSAGK